MTNGTVAVARLALSYPGKKGRLTITPARSLGLDAVVIALHTGQRHGDVLAL